MGIIPVKGPLSGQTYDVKIAGDAPTPEEIARADALVAQEEQRFASQYQSLFGRELTADDGTALSRGVDIGKTTAYGALGTAARDVGEALDFDWLQSLGGGMEASAQREQLREAVELPDPTRLDDVTGLGSGLTFLGEIAGQSAPEMAATLGATAAGTMLGTPAGGFAAGTAVATPLFYGRNIQHQEEQIDAGTLQEKNRLNAFLAAGGAAALNTIGDKLLLTGKALGLSVPASKNLFVRSAQFAGAGAATEVPTEITQQVLERAQAGLPLDDDEALKEYLEVGVAAGLLGGAIGGVSGPFRSSAPDTDPEPDATPLQIAGPETPLRVAGPETRVGLPAPGQGVPSTPPSAGRTVTPPVQPGQTRSTADIVPNLRPEATATARAIGSDPQLQAAVAAIKAEGKATIPVIQKALGVKPNVARGIMMKLERAGAVSKYSPGKPRALTLPFETPAAPSTESSDVGDLPDAGRDRASPVADPSRVADAEPGRGAKRTGKPAAPDEAGLGEPVPDTISAEAPAVRTPDAVDDQALVEEPPAKVKKTAKAKVKAAAADAAKATQGAVSRVASEMRPNIEEPPAPDGVADGAPAPGPAALERNAIGKGRELGTAEQAIPAPIEPVAGRMAQSDADKRAAELTDLTNNRTALEAELADIKDALGSRARITELARQESQQMQGKAGKVKPEDVRKNLRRRALKLEADLYRVRSTMRTQGVDASTTTETAVDTPAANSALQVQISDWYGKNAPEQVQQRDAETRSEDDTDVTTVEDKKAILALLTQSAGARKKSPGANAAFQYLSKTRNPSDGLENLAYDVGSPEKDIPKRRVSSKKAPLHPYDAGTGRTAALKAKQWVDDNLSPQAVAFVEDQASFYAKDDFDAVSAARDAQIARDREVAQQRAEYRGPAAPLRAGQREAIESEVTETTAGESYTAEELRQLRESDYDTVGDLFGEDLGALSSETGILFRKAVKTPRDSIVYGAQQPLHPSIVRAAQNNNLDGVLRGLATYNPDPYIRNLASKLRGYAGDTKVYVLSRQDPAFEWLRDTNGTYSHGGFLQESVAGIAAETDPVQQGIMTGRSNSILLNAETGLNAHTILHEMIHAATASELGNLSSPVRARLSTLLADAKAQVERTQGLDPEEIYGFDNVYEFVAEALSNQEFQAQLSQVFPNKKRVSAFTQFARAVTQFVRAKILKKAPKTYDDTDYTMSAFDEVDYLTQSVLSPAPQFSSRPLGESAIRPLSARDTLGSMRGRMADFDVSEARRMGRTLRDTATAAPVRKFLYDAFVPFRNLAEYAKENFPSAGDAYQLVTEHSRDIDRRNGVSRETINSIADYFKKMPGEVDLFNKFRTMASFYEVDVRRPRDTYSKFSLTYTPMDAQGLPQKRVYEYHATEAARDARLTELNLVDDPMRSKARIANTPDDKTLATYDYLRAMYDQLSPQGELEYQRILGLFETLHKEAARVYKARIESMLPGQAALQQKLYKDIFNNLFNEKSLEVYQPLQRAGDYWLTFNAQDFVTNTREVFKMSFATRQERTAYEQELRALPDTAKVDVDSIESSFKTPSFARGGDRPPTAFVAKVNSTLQKDAKAKAEKAREAALAEGADQATADRVYEITLNEQQQFVAETQTAITNLALDMMPERSFLQAYKKRQGYQGMLFGDAPVDIAVSPTDAVDMLLRKTTSLNRQLADMEYGAKAARVRTALTDELEYNMRTRPEADHENIKAQFQAIDRAMSNVFARRHPLVSKANSVTFAMTLGLNISSPVMNLMSIPTIIGPTFAAEYGAGKTARAFNNALKVLSASGRKRAAERVGSDGQIETFEKDAGRFGFSMRNYDFGDVDHTAGYAAGDNAANKYAYLQSVGEDRHLFADSTAYDYLEVQELAGHSFWDKFNRWSGAMMHYSEQYIRETTMIAAYDLELQKIAKAKGSDVLTEAEMRQAAENAAYKTELTNGTIPAAGAPNLAQRGVMPMIYMFKRYPLGIANMMVHMAQEAWPSKARLAEMYKVDTPEYKAALEGRKAARLQLAGVFGGIGLFAGASGLPMYSAIAALIDTFFRDDDELQTDELVRTAIGELGFKGLANYVLGVEMSSRIGLSGMFYREPLRAADQPPLWNLLEGAGGPALSIMHGWSTRTWDHYQNGDYYKMLESGSPAALRNMLRAMRFATTGAAESSRGDIIQDITPFSVLGQAMGFAPAPYIQQLEINSAGKKIDNAIREKRTKLLRRRNIALRQGDRAALRSAEADIREFNQRHPYNQITSDTKRRSQVTFNNTTEKVKDGIVYSDKNRDYVLKELERAESPATIFERLGQ